MIIDINQGNKACYLAPYLKDAHFQLLILCPDDYTVVFFCSLGNKLTHNDTCISIVNTLWNQFIVSKVLGGKKHLGGFILSRISKKEVGNVAITS